jgi:cytochrome P450
MSFVPPKPHQRNAAALLGGLFTRDGRSMLNLLPQRAFEVLMGVSRIARQHLFLVNAPETVREVLQERVNDFPKHTFIRDILQPLIGVSLFNANGQQWAQQERLVSPAFAQANLRRAFPAMLAAVDDLIARCDQLAPTQIWQADEAMSAVTADIIFRTILSKTLDPEAAQRVHTAFRAYQDNAQRVMGLSALRLPTFWHRARAQREAAAIRESFAERIRERHAAWRSDRTQQPADMLSALFEAHDPQTDARLSVDECIDQVGTLFLAGHETSASTLAWSLYLLAQQPEWQQRVRDEARALWADRPPEFGDTRLLGTTQAVFKETLRLYPPIAFYLREAACPTQLRGKPVCPHSMVAVSPWVVHRHRAFWQNPDDFDPGRFETAQGRESARSAYLPFGLGPRACPGAAFATQESVLILAMLVRRYRIAAVDGHTPRPTARLTLRSANGVQLRLVRCPPH